MIMIDGDIYVPSGLKSDPRFLMPDEVVLRCAKKFHLLEKGVTGIDPMCGAGTIPRVINANGGHCDGVEIDKDQFEVSRREIAQDATIILGDCREVKLKKTYDYIYTAMPLRLFQDPAGLDSSFADAFRKILKPKGTLLMDTIDVVERDGESWEVATKQIEYFESHGFRFDESVTFGVRKRQGICDEIFMELKFTKK